MTTSRQQHVKNNIIWGVLNKGIILILSFILRSMVIYYLGIEYAGLNSLFTSVLQMLNVAELGFGNAIVYCMYRPIVEKDDEKICALLALYRKCYLAIAALMAVVGIALIPFLPHLIKDYDAVGGINLNVLYIMYLANTVSSYLFLAYRRSLFIAHQENAIESNILSVVSIVQYSLQMLVLVLFKDYYLYTILLPIGTIILNLICGYISARRYPQYKPKGKIEREEFLGIVKMIKGMLFQKIGGMVLTGVDSIVISIFLGVAILGVYNNYYYIIIGLYEVFTVIMNGMKASVGNAMLMENTESNYKVLKLLNFLYVWLTTFVSVAFLCLAQPFVVIWLGSDYLLPNYMVLLFAIYIFMNKWFDMLFVFQEAAGLWWENRFIPLIAAVLNVVTNIILIQVIGLPGVVISTIVSFIVYDIGYAYILFKYYFHSFEFFWEYIFNQFKLLTGWLIGAPLTYWLCSLLQNDGFIGLIWKGIVCVIVPNIVFAGLFHRKDEYKEMLSLLKGLLGIKR